MRGRLRGQTTTSVLTLVPRRNRRRNMAAFFHLDMVAAILLASSLCSTVAAVGLLGIRRLVAVLLLALSLCSLVVVFLLVSLCSTVAVFLLV